MSQMFGENSGFIQLFAETVATNVAPDMWRKSMHFAQISRRNKNVALFFHFLLRLCRQVEGRFNCKMKKSGKVWCKNFHWVLPKTYFDWKSTRWIAVEVEFGDMYSHHYYMVRILLHVITEGLQIRKCMFFQNTRLFSSKKKSFQPNHNSI